MRYARSAAARRCAASSVAAEVRTGEDGMTTYASKLDHCSRPTCRKAILPTEAFFLFNNRRYCLDCGAEELAREFHATYERLAPDFGYKTREESAKPWSEVPEDNRKLMIATARAILGKDALL